MPQKFIKDQVYARNGRMSRSTSSMPAVNGRLTTLSEFNENFIHLMTDSEQSKGAVVLNFPSMPDSVELTRRAVYASKSIQMTPDGGLVWYQYTEPLRIPFSFRLHAFDTDYCPQGALTLLDVAAKLQSLVLPFGPPSYTYQISAEVEGNDGKARSLSETDLQFAQDVAVTFSNDALSYSPPPTVLLDLIYVGNDAPGISCVGYIDEVTTKFNGPWLASPGAGHKNLPSSLDASFVFIHRPGHTNVFSAKQTASQAMADSVKDRLFNTVNLLTPKRQRGYRVDETD